MIIISICIIFKWYLYYIRWYFILNVNIICSRCLRFNVQFNLVSRGNAKFPPFARKARALHPTYKNRITLDTRTRNSGACCAEASSAAICLRSHLHRIPFSTPAFVPRRSANFTSVCYTSREHNTLQNPQRVSLCVVYNEVRRRSCVLFFFFNRRREAGLFLVRIGIYGHSLKVYVRQEANGVRQSASTWRTRGPTRCARNVTSAASTFKRVATSAFSNECSWRASLQPSDVCVGMRSRISRHNRRRWLKALFRMRARDKCHLDFQLLAVFPVFLSPATNVFPLTLIPLTADSISFSSIANEAAITLMRVLSIENSFWF